MIRKILIVLCLWYCESGYAQFNTIGHIENQQQKYVPKYTLTVDDDDPMDDNDEEPDISSVNEYSTSEDSLLSIDDKWVFSLPVQGELHITSLYGMRFHPTLHKWKFHNGMDIRARYEPVLAMMPGVVYKTGYDNASGNYITLKHGDIYVSYCHLSEIWSKVGQYVFAGLAIAKSGNTGRSSAPHLHLCCRVNNKRINILILLRKLLAVDP